MRPALSFLVLLFAIGCGQSRSVTSPSIVSQRKVSVSGDDPFIAMEDGTRIGVDGVPSGQSMQVTVTQYKDSNGKLAIEWTQRPQPLLNLNSPNKPKAFPDVTPFTPSRDADRSNGQAHAVQRWPWIVALCACSYFAVSALTLPFANTTWFGELPPLALIQLPKSFLKSAVHEVLMFSNIFDQHTMRKLAEIEYLSGLFLEPGPVAERAVKDFQKQRPDIMVTVGLNSESGYREYPRRND